MSEEIDDIHETPETKSFISEKAGYELFGKPLHAYSPSRKVAAQAMGMLYPYVGEAGAAQMELTGRYPGQVQDMVIVLWLCTLPDPRDIEREEKEKDHQYRQRVRSMFTPAKASRVPEIALTNALEWADEQGILNMGPKEEDASRVFIAIVSGLSASEFRIQVEGADSAQANDSPNV